MHVRTGPATALALLVTFGAVSAALGPNEASAQAGELRGLDGEWLYVEDRTEGRAVEQQQPSMSAKFALRVEEDAVVLVRRDFEVRMALDGSPTDIPRENGSSRYSGTWRDGAFAYEIEQWRASDTTRSGLIRFEMRPTAEGLLTRVEVVSPTEMTSVALYRHPNDIELPASARATMRDMAWLDGAWVGTRGTSGTTSIEERWSPPLGGAMLGVSRTVSRGSMVGFEFLRIVERDSGLVYIAQPGGAPPTEFVLTEMGSNRAVFENPRHDFPQRIVYELSADGRLSASVGYARGGRPQRFEFNREGS